MMYDVVPGRCPWCGSDRETVYENFHGPQKICANCIMKLNRDAWERVWEPLLRLAGWTPE